MVRNKLWVINLTCNYNSFPSDTRQTSRLTIKEHVTYVVCFVLDGKVDWGTVKEFEKWFNNRDLAIAYYDPSEFDVPGGFTLDGVVEPLGCLVRPIRDEKSFYAVTGKASAKKGHFNLVRLSTQVNAANVSLLFVLKPNGVKGYPDHHSNKQCA